MSNIENKILRQENGKKENIGEAAKRIAAVVLSVGIMLGVSGCSTNSNANVSNADVSSSTSCDSQNLEEEWKEAVSAEKQLIYNWFTSEIATPETLENLCKADYERGMPKSWSISDKDYLPEYNFGRFLEIIELIGSYYETLDNISADELTGKNPEEIIGELRAEFGIVINDNKVTFNNIPTFENEVPEEKEKIYSVTNHYYSELSDGEKLSVMFIMNCNQFDEKKSYVYSSTRNGVPFECNKFTSAGEEKRYRGGFYSTFDVLFSLVGYHSLGSLEVDGEKVKTINCTAEEVFNLLAPIFEGDLEFEELCKKYGFDFDITD